MALTGKAYLESLDDGREVWLDGTRVEHLQDHPSFRNTARSIAALYDSLHDPESPPNLSWTTERGTLSHRAFRIARTRRHLSERAAAMRTWAEMHYGFMGRTPDYKAGLAVGLGAYPSYFEEYSANATAWYQRMTDDVLFMNHVGVNPMVDRTKRPHQLRDINVRAVSEDDAGFVVTGAKMVGTAAAFTHANLVFSSANLPLDERDTEQALVFIVPTNAEGLKLISRPSYEGAVSARSPFDYPLSSRFDENDATMVFDHVHIPWENCLVYRNADRANRFFTEAQVVQNLMLHGAVRFATKMRFVCGLLIKVAQQNGTIDYRGTRIRLGEAIGYCWTMDSLVRDSCTSPDPGPGGSVAPSHRSIFALRALAPKIYPLMRELLQLVGAGGFVQLPSGSEDLLSEVLRPYIDRYYRGAAVDAEERIKLWKLAWDAIGSEFGARQELFERSYAGNYDNVRLENLFLAEHNGDRDRFAAEVDRCMSEYDLRGWVSSVWKGDDDGGNTP
jgi:4-hydroxyphenylacetate 3-monooxygenase